MTLLLSMFSSAKRILSKAISTCTGPERVTDRTVSALWISLSVGALMLAGFLSIFIMLGRTPVIYEQFTNPHWFKRVLVVHVDLALLVWFYGFLCGLFVLIPSSKSKNRRPIVGYLLAVTGVLLITSSIFITTAKPVLSNYIPILNNPVFIIGILFFGTGVGISLLNKRLWVVKRNFKHPLLPDSAIPGLQSAAIVLFLSLVVFIMAWISTSPGYHVENYYEFIIWGGGHLLQFVNIALSVVVWLILLKKLLGRNPLSYKWSALLFALFTLPVVASPLLLINGTSDPLYLTGFTRYMQWGIFPVISIFMILITGKLIRAYKRDALPPNLIANPYFNGLVISLIFIVLSFLLGALIQGSNTIVPAHYHASLGGITIALMVTVYLLMDFYGIPSQSKKLQKWAAKQPVIFGLGQFIFVMGLAYAGTYGLARKVFGPEQQISSVKVYTGLSLLFIGGSMAIFGGVLFFWIVLKRWKAHQTAQ